MARHNDPLHWSKDEVLLNIWRSGVDDIYIYIEIEQMSGVEVFKWKVTRSDGVLYNFAASCAADSLEQAAAQAKSIVDAIRSWDEETNDADK